MTSHSSVSSMPLRALQIRPTMSRRYPDPPSTSCSMRLMRPMTSSERLLAMRFIARSGSAVSDTSTAAKCRYMAFALAGWLPNFSLRAFEESPAKPRSASSLEKA